MTGRGQPRPGHAGRLARTIEDDLAARGHDPECEMTGHDGNVRQALQRALGEGRA